MLRRDLKISQRQVGTGFLGTGEKVHRLQHGEYLAKDYFILDFKLETWNEIQREQANVAVLLGAPRERPGKRLWLFRGELYWDDESLDAEAVTALVLEKKLKLARKIEKARSVVSPANDSGAEGTARRVPISREVQLFVWQRDQGRCVKCGSGERLEFDHIIPFSRGGSSTARNVQLLCEACNRSKHNSIG